VIIITHNLLNNNKYIQIFFIGENDLIISKSFNRVMKSRSKENLIVQPQILCIQNSGLQNTVEINPKAILCGVLFMKDVIHYKIFDKNMCDYKYSMIIYENILE
jgi:hypothetical protein